MTLQIRPAEPGRLADFVGEVGGIDLSHPASPAEVAAIVAGMDHFAVLVFRDQKIDDEQQLAFSRNFGTLEHATGDIAPAEERRLAVEVADISNLDRDNEVLARDDRRRLFSLGNMLWHSDSSFKADPGQILAAARRASCRRRAATPNSPTCAPPTTHSTTTPRRSARTWSACTARSIRAASWASPNSPKRSRRATSPVPQRLVRRHPGSGRRSLFLSAHAGEIVGWPVPEARAFLRDLNEHATQRAVRLCPPLAADDLVMWDNRCIMHRARRYDPTEVRDLHRTTVADVAPTLHRRLKERRADERSAIRRDAAEEMAGYATLTRPTD